MIYKRNRKIFFHKVVHYQTDIYLVASDNFNICRISGQLRLLYWTYKKRNAKLNHKWPDKKYLFRKV